MSFSSSGSSGKNNNTNTNTNSEDNKDDGIHSSAVPGGSLAGVGYVTKK